jgi:hypothetical protein
VKNRKVLALELPRQYPLVLMVKIYWREGNMLRSEEGEVLKSGLYYVQGDKLSRDFAMLDQNFDMTAGKAACHTWCAT